MVAFKIVKLDSSNGNASFINSILYNVVKDLNRTLANKDCVDHPNQKLEIEIALFGINESYHLKMSHRCCHNFIEDLKIEIGEILKLQYTSEIVGA